MDLVCAGLAYFTLILLCTLTDAQRARANRRARNANASVIYLEQPAGVGFSYCNPKSPCAFNDATQADDTFAFLEKFFEGFPEFKVRSTGNLTACILDFA